MVNNFVFKMTLFLNDFKLGLLISQQTHSYVYNKLQPGSISAWMIVLPEDVKL